MLNCGKNKIIQTVVVSEFGYDFKQIAFDALDKAEKQAVTDLASLKKKQIETKDCPQGCPEKKITDEGIFKPRLEGYWNYSRERYEVIVKQDYFIEITCSEKTTQKKEGPQVAPKPESPKTTPKPESPKTPKPIPQPASPKTEPKPEPPYHPEGEGGDQETTILETPCQCPCPIGFKAVVKIQEDVTPINFNLLKTPIEITKGTITKFFHEYPEKTIKISYDLHQKDNIGLGNDGNVNLMYTLTIYYASAPPTSCCESGTIEFKGDLTIKGSYKPFFSDKVTVTAKTSVKGDDSFSSCTTTGKDQCKKVFKDDLDLGFPFVVPRNPIPGLKNWDDGHVKIKGDFTVTVITKKTN